jgi:hypothetical protein
MKGESAVGAGRGETELLAADVLHDEAATVDGHPPEIRMVIEVVKQEGPTSRPSPRASSSPTCTHQHQGWPTRSAPRTWRQWQPPKEHQPTRFLS